MAATACTPSCRWTLRANVGRIKGQATSMPDNWGKTGATLPFTLQVDVQTAPISTADERVGDSAFTIEPQCDEVSVTGFSGAMRTPVESGGWNLEEGQLKFWLNLPEGISRCEDGDNCNVWDLAPGVEMQGTDIDLPPGRLYFETDVVDHSELERLNREYLAARSSAWQAKEKVDTMENAKNPAPVWSADKGEWVVEAINPGFFEEQKQRAALGAAKKAQEQADERRPKRKDLARDAGQWPTGSPTRWLGNKGTLWIKRTGPFGELPFGVGHHYTKLGTWSAEPVDPIETFWTMAD